MNTVADLIYWDSSALIKRYRQEIGHQQVMKLFKSQEHHCTASLTHAEILATFCRLRREGFITSVILDQLIEEFISDWREILSVAYESSIQKTARQLCQISSLRGADLVHLASAESLRREGLNVRFVTFDQKLSIAAQELGLLQEDEKT